MVLMFSRMACAWATNLRPSHTVLVFDRECMAKRRLQPGPRSPGFSAAISMAAR